ncbi:hypothetical protein [Candidatus Accumulibacter sp. ACC007]|uniref:hypothetical protein n=1 Tax=Candidatus Accumulibacter sp. ACC007 TaxID=2823333 RepID=UPI0025C1F5B4|nr:hypothetical protein [Candidatus Accumulibacter sp. ACC007]
MSAKKSFLSSQKYGYDFVVATTQASINSGLKEYLDTIDQPTASLCFLADTKGNPTVQISLDDLQTRTGGIDPFEIPDGTDYSDPRIATLTKNMFVVGLKLKLGLPPGVMPKDMPAIVDLGSSANNVRFNLFCSEFEVIQNSPPSGFGGQGSWNVWSQPSGTPWYFSTTVNLVYEALDNELDTPYFNNHPEQKKALLNQLKNLGSGAFSLQQLLFDLDNAVVQSIPRIAGLDPSSDAGLILTKSFVNLYFASAKTHGEPVLSVHAVANAPDGSSLRLTGMEREVSQFRDGNGVVVANPTPAQKQVVTLDYLCAANNNHLPGAAGFDWNWVDPANVDNESGIISINRTTLANYYRTLLASEVSRSCLKPWTSVTAHMMGSLDTNMRLTPGQTPQNSIIVPTGPTVLKISYASNADNHDKSGLTYGEFDLHSSYDCSVSFAGSTITIVQHLVLYIYLQFDYTSASGNVVDTTITDTYTLSVGQNGQLQSTASSSTQDRSTTPDYGWFFDILAGGSSQKQIAGIKNYSNSVAKTTLKDIPAQDIQNFVFPGARVFTYKDVQFSENQDLVTAVTYVKPG